MRHSRLAFAAAFVFPLAACGAPSPQAERSPLLVMTGLPLFLGEVGPEAVLNDGDQRAGIVRALVARRLLLPVDSLDTEALGRARRLLLIQPRLLSGTELVALDAWVREGGKVLIFADPALVWPSDLPVGDPRRAPPVTLLDPLLSHWGLVLDTDGDDARAAQSASIGGRRVRVVAGGRWRATTSGCAIADKGLVARCRIGRGRAILVADADLLDDRHWTALGDETVDAVMLLLEQLDQPMRVRGGT
jgi:hypothetical protein